MLEEFELVSSGRMKPFITLRDMSITFSKVAIQNLEFSEFVHLFIDKKNRRVAFQACGDDEESFVFYRPPKPGRSILVRITGKHAASRVKELAGLETCGGGIRYYGEFISDEGLLVIDMKQKGVRAKEEE